MRSRSCALAVQSRGLTQSSEAHRVAMIDDVMAIETGTRDILWRAIETVAIPRNRSPNQRSIAQSSGKHASEQRLQVVIQTITHQTLKARETRIRALLQMARICRLMTGRQGVRSMLTSSANQLEFSKRRRCKKTLLRQTSSRSLNQRLHHSLKTGLNSENALYEAKKALNNL